MSNTTTRILTAVVVVPILLGFIFWGGAPFAIFVSVCMVVGIWEFYRMAELKGFTVQKVVGLTIPPAVTLALGAHHPRFAVALGVLGILSVPAIALRERDPKNSLGNSSATIMGMVYVGFLLCHAVLIREYLGERKVGIFFLLLALAGSMLCDTGAYFVGRAYGKRKLIPHISPGKTVEGSIGGIAGGIFGVYLFKVLGDLFFRTPLGWGDATLLGVLLAVVGMIGDLVESMFKRDAGVKDSGNVFPGHGGMLDRLDSPLFTLPTTFYFALYVL